MVWQIGVLFGVVGGRGSGRDIERISAKRCCFVGGWPKSTEIGLWSFRRCNKSAVSLLAVRLAKGRQRGPLRRPFEASDKMPRGVMDKKSVLIISKEAGQRRDNVFDDQGEVRDEIAEQDGGSSS